MRILDSNFLSEMTGNDNGHDVVQERNCYQRTEMGNQDSFLQT